MNAIDPNMNDLEAHDGNPTQFLSLNQSKNSKRRRIDDNHNPNLKEGEEKLEDGSHSEGKSDNNSCSDGCKESFQVEAEQKISESPVELKRLKQGSQVSVSQSTTMNNNSHNSSTTHTLYIGGLDPRVLKVHLEKMFGRYGTVQRLHCCYRDNNSSNNNNRGPQMNSNQHQGPNHRNNHNNNNNNNNYWFAFCQMETAQQADTARRALDGQMLLGKRLVVRPANANQNSPPSSALTTGSGTNSSSATNSSKLESQQRSLEEKISAIKRKLQQKPA